MTPSQKLIERLREDLDLPEVCHVHRLYPSPNQRSLGAWSWILMQGPSDPCARDIVTARYGSGAGTTHGWGGVAEIGSQWPVRELLRAKKLDISGDVFGFSIDPA